MNLLFRFLLLSVVLAASCAAPSACADVGVGAKPLPGAEVILDGSREMLDDKWTYWEGPRFSSSLPIKWKIVDDPVDGGTCVMTDDPAAAGGKYGTADIVTKKPYRDFRLHIEFLITKPGGNSGVYLQNRYEIQVLDGDRSKHGMGAVINETESPYHAYNGVGKWNAYDITFRAARFKDGQLSEKALVSMYFNGKKVHDNVVINKVWGGPNSGVDGGNDNGFGITDTPQGLKLQCEGHDVRYRNAWIKPLDLTEAETDFTDKAKNLQPSPIGLQLPSNNKPQEYRFRGLVLTENPEDKLITTRPVWTQQPEIQQAMERGVEPEQKPDSEKSAITDAAFGTGPNPKWIWGDDNNSNYVLQTTFSASGIKAALLKASCDNVGSVAINGRQVASGSEWQEPMAADVTEHIVDGRNTITATVSNQGGVAAFVLKLALQDEAGQLTHVVSDADWTIVAKNLDDGKKVALRGDYGDGPWGAVFDNSSEYTGRVPQGVFDVLPGYQVEKLFTVPKDELGSWVCIAFDNKGRLLASDQGGKGICRITLPPVTAAAAVSAGTEEASAETRVERLDFSNCEFQPTGAQGMLWAFDSLYFSCNGGPGSGLYRARDLDGDDQFDECVKLKSFRGGGEHGPHSLRLSPDGQRIFVIAGNHTDPPFAAGEEFDNKNYSSRIPTNWGEDLLLPRMWDANGHARGKLAPGGWIASTDPDGQTWQIWSVGYRNPYDMAFNADGELFAYDADMEWDVGTPWYRPTRVVHATSGSEFGWRSGTGKWPEYYVDSLPALVDIGPGSPVGVTFGYERRERESFSSLDASDGGDSTAEKNPDPFFRLKFPAKYQQALYICDWTFGTMYAIHLEPHQSSYRGVKEEFVARSPLPLTDCAAGPDGALYFTIGGRGTQSELFRVTYVGDESTEPAELHQSAFAAARQHRRHLEQFHGRAGVASPDLPSESNDFLQNFTEDMVSGDRFLKTAMRNAFFNSEILWKEFTPKLLHGLAADVGRDDSSPKADEVIGATVAFAKTPPAHVGSVRGSKSATAEWKTAARDASMRLLGSLTFQDLSAMQQLNYLRALSLSFIRLGEPTADDRDGFLQQLDPAFPSTDHRVNRELCQVLVYLKSPTVVAKTVALMNQPPQREDIDMGELLTRNAGYGRAIKAMIDNQPDKQQMWYAFCLRVAEVGWTPELRADYYRWFGRAQTWSGGNSFRKFLQNIEDEAWQKTPFDHRVLVEKAGARTPYQAPELPRPAGPGKNWSMEEVRALASDGLKGRSFENGQKMFAATRCILCHRFAGDGGATGPDLTQLAGRFSIEALTEAIMDPSKVISDQYKASTVVTSAGKQVNGRIVSENEQQISVLIDPEDSTKIVDIPKNDIDEIVPSAVSIMPADLLKTLNQDEVLDLLAYLLSRGDEKHPMFRK